MDPVVEPVRKLLKMNPGEKNMMPFWVGKCDVVKKQCGERLRRIRKAGWND
jgi:hypothetical protein